MKTMKNNKLTVVSYLILPVILLMTVSFSLIFGAESIKLTNGSLDEVSKIILFKLRLPRTLLVILTGLLLGGSGCIFQNLFRNPLAEPGIIGMSSGASLGAVLSGYLGMGTVFGGFLSCQNLGAFAGAFVAGLIVISIAFLSRGENSTVTLILCGTALGSFYSAVVSILLTIRSEQLHSVYVWMLGSFSGRGWNELKFILIPSILSLILIICLSPSLELFNGGEYVASSLGLNVNFVRIAVLFAGSLATSCAVCAGGTIGFAGLIAPHLARKIWGQKGVRLAVLSMFMGAVLLLISDTIARVILRPSEIPVGTITSLLGAPFFVSIILNKWRAK